MKRCEICGEPVRPDEEAAEMYDPRSTTTTPEHSLFCHAQCGLSNGMEVA